ncbi:MAG: thiolase domain-containing protein [Candidatus Aenigmarchaeota archaeon]|nr:thiolase domain-containing protein [Candidatus Aenigmarchaeota archaeon]
MRDVAIVGVGMTKFGEHWKKGLRELISEAGIKAVDDAGISGKDIQLIVGGSMSSGIFAGQEHTGALFTDYLGLNPIPAIRTEAACASSSVALSTGVMAIQSGRYNCVVVGGVEKMTDVYGGLATTALAGAMDRDNEAHFGLTFPGVYALMAKRHMHQYGTTREQIAMSAVKNHENAMHNPNAQFHRKITVDDVLKSPLVADPLRLLDCSPIADGAASLIIVPADKAKQYTDTPIYIRASSQASDTLSLYRRSDITTIGATITAAQNAYKQAGMTTKDIHFAEVHDCFTINEIISTEDLGFARKGDGGRLLQSGETMIGGKIPVNTSGGLKAKGHPVGATGAAQVIEAVEQLRGDAGGRQVDGAENGLTHNVGGSGSTVVVHIFSRNRK